MTADAVVCQEWWPNLLQLLDFTLLLFSGSFYFSFAAYYKVNLVGQGYQIACRLTNNENFQQSDIKTTYEILFGIKY